MVVCETFVYFKSRSLGKGISTTKVNASFVRSKPSLVLVYARFDSIRFDSIRYAPQARQELLPGSVRHQARTEVVARCGELGSQAHVVGQVQYERVRICWHAHSVYTRHSLERCDSLQAKRRT